MTLARIPGPIGSLFRGVQVYAFNEADHPRADDGKFGSGGGKTHTVVLPRDPRKLTTGQVTAALEQLGYKQGRRKFDLATKQAVTELTRPDGTMQWASVDEIAEILYRGAAGGDRRAKKAEPYAAILGGILGVQRYATDEQGHEHVESGPAGGQFTSKGGGGGKGESEPKGKAEPKPEADKPEAPRSHKDAYRDLIAKAKEMRRAAWNEARAKAKESDEAANAQIETIHKANSSLTWESGNDAFDAYREMDELIADFDPDWSVEDRMTGYKEIGAVAKAALKVEADPDDEDPDRITEKDIEENRPKLQAIVAHVKAARDHLRAYVAARREVQAIKSGKWQQYAAVLGGLGVQTYDAGQGVTIGGARGEDGKRHGGSPVFIKDGKIVKGHPSLTGKKIGALKEAAEEGPKKDRGRPATNREEAADRAARSRKDNRESADYDRARWRKKARAEGHDPKHMEELAGEVKAHHDAFAAERKDLLRAAREFSKANGFADLRQLNVLASKGKHDATMLRGFDLTSEAVARQFPALFREETGENGSHADQLFDMLTGGEPEPMSQDDAFEQALNILEESKHSGSAPSRSVPDDDDEAPF